MGEFEKQTSGRRVVVYGGVSAPLVDGHCESSIDWFAGCKVGGNGDLKRLLAALRSGRVTAVVCVPSGLGHSGWSSARKLARDLRIPWIQVTGGASAVVRALRALGAATGPQTTRRGQ